MTTQLKPSEVLSNEPAFSASGFYIPHLESYQNGQNGMSIRQYAAIHSDIPFDVAEIYARKDSPDGRVTYEEVLKIRAQMQITHADALMEELSK